MASESQLKYEAMSESYDERMAGASGFSALVYLLSSCAVSYLNSGTLTTFLSVKGIVFLVVGMVAMAFFVGIPSFVLQRDLSRLVLRFTQGSDHQKYQWISSTIGTAVLVLQILVIFYVTKLMFLWYFDLG